MSGFGKDGKGVIIREDNAIALGNLAARSAILFPALALEEDFRMLKSEIWALWDDFTDGDGDKAILGLACAELSLAEIEEALELNGPINRNDRLQDERATRPVWLIEGFHEGGSNAALRMAKQEWKKRWTFSNADGWNFFVYNQSNSAMTTGSTVRLFATHYGVWVQ